MKTDVKGEKCKNRDGRRADGLKVLQDGAGVLRSPFWYARFTRNGQKVDVSLDVRIEGVPPRNEFGRIDLMLTGDAAFENSRNKAADALADMRKAAQTRGKSKAVKDAETADLVNRYHRARTGHAIESPRLDALGELWDALARSRPPTAERSRNAHNVFTRFGTFARRWCGERGTRCATLDEITPELAAAWFDDLRGGDPSEAEKDNRQTTRRGYSWGTVKDNWQTMRRAWVRWHVYAGRNPFEGVIVRGSSPGGEKVERRPLTEAELARLFDATRDDAGLHDLTVAAACTGMRIGDVCNMKWDDVDLPGGLIDAVTAKAGVRVTVPVFAPLREVLERRRAVVAVGDSPFVFPAFAEAYNHVNAEGMHDRRTGIFRRIKPYFARVMFDDADETPATDANAGPLPLADGLAAIDAAGFADAKRERVRDIYARFKRGETYADICEALKIAKGQVSDYLRDAEQVTGETLRPGLWKRGKSARDLVARTRSRRGVGKNAASLFGWHNLRHTFVVLAIQSGVPAEKVRRIVGHGDVSTTLDNYFNPTRANEAERVRRQMSGTVLATGTAQPFGPVIDAEAADVPAIEAKTGIEASDEARTCKGAEIARRDSAPVPACPARDAAQRMAEAKKLLDAGFITADEYQAKRAQILAEI